MCLAQGHSTMTVVPRLGIEPGTPGFEIPEANHSTTADSLELLHLCSVSGTVSPRVLRF